MPVALGCPILKKPFLTKQESQSLPSAFYPILIGSPRKLARLCNAGFPDLHKGPLTVTFICLEFPQTINPLRIKKHNISSAKDCLLYTPFAMEERDCSCACRTHTCPMSRQTWTPQEQISHERMPHGRYDITSSCSDRNKTKKLQLFGHIPFCQMECQQNTSSVLTGRRKGISYPNYSKSMMAL